MSEWYARREGWNPQDEDARDMSDIDYARIIHSASFRRLQGKTQILNLGDSDFYRTRLTHSMEVAQIAGGITRQFEKHMAEHPAIEYLPATSLIQAIGLSHDLGHPPFGHGGEVALNYCMRAEGGFEGNGQTLRILSKLEKFSSNAGANLTRRLLLGVLKYPVSYDIASNPDLTPELDKNTTTIRIIDRGMSKPPKCYMKSEKDIVDWILDPLSAGDRDLFISYREKEGEHFKAQHKSFDCSIMDLADDISFGVHDLEDTLSLKLISENDFRKHVSEEDCDGFLTHLKNKYGEESGNDVYEYFVKALFGDGSKRKRFIGRMVGYLITNCNISTLEEFDEPLLKYRASLPEKPMKFLKALKRVVRETVTFSSNVQHLEFKGQQMVVSVFEALSSEPDKFLPKDTLEVYEKSSDPTRVVCDHIAGMTDNFLLKTYDRLFSPRMGSVFDKL